MPKPYQNTISGLLKKRSELMGEAQRLREELATVGNSIEALDRTLGALGYEGDLKCITPRSHRIVFFARDELRRFLLDELRKSNGPIGSRDLAEKIIKLEGKDPHDRRMRNEMVKRVGKSLKLLRQQGVAISARDELGHFVWRLAVKASR
jgi:hypothetical protein